MKYALYKNLESKEWVCIPYLLSLKAYLQDQETLASDFTAWTRSLRHRPSFYLSANAEDEAAWKPIRLGLALNENKVISWKVLLVTHGSCACILYSCEEICPQQNQRDIDRQPVSVDRRSNETAQEKRNCKQKNPTHTKKPNNIVSGGKNKVLPFSSIYHRKRVVVNMKGTSVDYSMHEVILWRLAHTLPLSLSLSLYIYIIYHSLYYMTLNIIAAICSQC